MTFANALREYRKAARIPGRQLARRCGLSPSAVSRYESGERMPRYETVEAMALEMGLDREGRVRLMLAAGYIPDNVRRNPDIIRTLVPLIVALGTNTQSRSRTVAVESKEVA